MTIQVFFLMLFRGTFSFLFVMLCVGVIRGLHVGPFQILVQHGLGSYPHWINHTPVLFSGDLSVFVALVFLFVNNGVVWWLCNGHRDRNVELSTVEVLL